MSGYNFNHFTGKTKGTPVHTTAVYLILVATRSRYTTTEVSQDYTQDNRLKMNLSWKTSPSAV